MIENRNWYDVKSGNYCGSMNNAAVYPSRFVNLLIDAMTDGKYIEMMHLFALNTVVRVPLMSLCKPGVNGCLPVHPFTTHVVGLQVTDEPDNEPTIIIGRRPNNRSQSKIFP